MKKIFFVLVIFIFFNFSAFSQTEGEKAFTENRPLDATVLLESEIENGTASADAYNFLGLSYYQLGNYEKSVEVFENGLKVPKTNKKILAYNEGNSYYAMQKYSEAARSYSLAFSADSTFSKALLNRANAYLMAEEFQSALSDYEKYIELEPEDEQKEQILLMIEALKKEIERREEEAKIAALEAERQAEEEKRLAEEMERIKAEEERIAAEEKAKKEADEAELRRIEEEKKAAEAERRRKLLEDVANSLQNTDSTNMSAGTEDLIDYETEGELD